MSNPQDRPDGLTLERIAELRKWSTFEMDPGEYQQLLDLAERALKAKEPKTPATEGREPQFRPGDGGWHIGGRNGLARRQANGMWFYRLNDGTEGYCHYREDAERWIDDQPAPPPAQEGIPTPAPEGRESLELSDNRDAAFAALGEIYKLCGYTLDGMPEQYDPRLFINAVAQRLRTQSASPPAQARPTREQVMGRVLNVTARRNSMEFAFAGELTDEIMKLLEGAE